MGPVSRAALVKAQQADTKFKSALIEELQGIREILNRMSGQRARDEEISNERLADVEGRVSELERTRPA